MGSVAAVGVDHDVVSREFIVSACGSYQHDEIQFCPAFLAHTPVGLIDILGGVKNVFAFRNRAFGLVVRCASRVGFFRICAPHRGGSFQRTSESDTIPPLTAGDRNLLGGLLRTIVTLPKFGRATLASAFRLPPSC